MDSSVSIVIRLLNETFDSRQRQRFLSSP
jgi:hypothetical protein